MPYSRPPLERGIYRSPFLTQHGYRELVAVDRHGRQRARAVIFRHDVERDISRMLRRLLDDVDPDPTPWTAQPARH